MPEREKLADRRESSTVVVSRKSFDGSMREWVVTFGWGPTGIREVFCTASYDNPKMKTGSDEQAFINDSCIAISLLLQHGVHAAALARAFGEDRPMSQPNDQGPPSSPLGAIAREAVRLEKEFT